MSRNWTLRPYDPSDFDSLYQIDQACYPPGIAYSKRTLRWFLHQRGAVCILAHDADEISGFILAESDAVNARQKEGGLGHIITLDVMETHRRCGLGSALLVETENVLARRGIRRIELETATDNDAAIAFWKKHGYRTRGILQRYYLDRIDAYWMQKSLP